MPCGFSGHWPGSCAGLGMDPLRVLWKGPSKIISPQRVAPWRQKGAVGEMCWSDGEKRSLYNLGDSWCDQCTAAPRRTLPGLSSAAQQPFTLFSSWALLITQSQSLPAPPHSLLLLQTVLRLATRSPHIYGHLFWALNSGPFFPERSSNRGSSLSPQARAELNENISLPCLLLVILITVVTLRLGMVGRGPSLRSILFPFCSPHSCAPRAVGARMGWGWDGGTTLSPTSVFPCLNPALGT